MYMLDVLSDNTYIEIDHSIPNRKNIPSLSLQYNICFVLSEGPSELAGPSICRWWCHERIPVVLLGPQLKLLPSCCYLLSRTLHFLFSTSVIVSICQSKPLELPRPYLMINPHPDSLKFARTDFDLNIFVLISIAFYGGFLVAIIILSHFRLN